MAKRTPKPDEYDFISDDDSLAEEKSLPKVTEIATGGNPKAEDTTPKLTPEIIQLARKQAASPRGLNIEEFFQKYKITLDIEYLLNGKLDKDGNLL